MRDDFSELVKRFQGDGEPESGCLVPKRPCRFCGQEEHKPLICRSELSASQGTGKLWGFDFEPVTNATLYGMFTCRAFPQMWS